MSQAALRSSPGPRVLIARLSAVGDCIQTMPLAAALREHFPQAHLTWAVEKAAAPLVGAVAGVDRVLVVPKRFAQSPTKLWTLRRELRGAAVDLSLDPQGLTKSGLVAWLSGARRRIGLARPASREINAWFQTEWVVSQAPHRIERYLELLRPLGIERPSVRFDLRIPVEAHARAEVLAQQPALRSGFAALNPGAGWDSKRWPVERYAQVAARLAAGGVPSVVTWAGAAERAWAETIVAESRGAAQLAPPTTLLELAALLARARLFVGSDTGPMHLAMAVGTPCVALFGASDGAACGPYGPGHAILQAAHDQTPGRKHPGAHNWAMRQITVDMVARACDQLLIRDRRRAEQAA